MKHLLGISIFIIACFAVFLDGMGEGIRNNINDSRTIWHAYNGFSMLFYAVSFLLMIYQRTPVSELMIKKFRFTDYLKKCGYCLLLLIGLRFAVFDYVHNYFFGVNIFYVGETSFLDKIYANYILQFFPPVFLFILKIFIFIILFFEISLVLKKENYGRKQPWH
jgi:hypothetical protein